MINIHSNAFTLWQLDALENMDIDASNFQTWEEIDFFRHNYVSALIDRIEEKKRREQRIIANLVAERFNSAGNNTATINQQYHV